MALSAVLSNNKALLEGRAGPKFERGEPLAKALTGRGGREMPVNVGGGYEPGGQKAQPETPA
jgi:hypothetical protein